MDPHVYRQLMARIESLEERINTLEEDADILRRRVRQLEGKQ